MLYWQKDGTNKSINKEPECELSHQASMISYRSHFVNVGKLTYISINTMIVIRDVQELVQGDKYHLKYSK